MTEKIRRDICISLSRHWVKKQDKVWGRITLPSIRSLGAKPTRETLNMESHTSVNPLPPGPIFQYLICFLIMMG